MGIAPQTILIPKGGIFLTSQDNSIVPRQTWWLKPSLTWWQEPQKKFVTTPTRWQQLKKRFPTAPLLLRQANRRRRAPQVNRNFAVKIPLRQLRQTRFCWPFSNWQRTPIQPISTIILAESRNCLNPSQRQCLRLMGNQRNSNCLKIYSKRVWKSTISWRKKTRYTTSTLMRGDALQTFKNITSPNRENLGEILTVFRRKYVKPQSMATAKHKFQRLVFNPAKQKLIDFLDELQKLAKDAFGVAAQAIIEQFIYAKMPPHLKKSINQAHLENGTYEQIVSHLERELEINGLEAPDEMPINTVTQQAPQQNSNKPRPTCHHCKKPGHYQNQCRQLKREKDQTRNNINSANNNNNGSAQTNSNPNNNKVANNTKGSNINNQRDRKSRPVFPPCETCGRTNHSTEKWYLGANAANRPPPRNRRPVGQNQVQQRNAHSNSDRKVQAAAQTLN